jgi:hypothetical protein
VAIYLPDNELPKEKPVIGTRQDAEITAHSIIDVWMTNDFLLPAADCSEYRKTAGLVGAPNEY